MKQITLQVPDEKYNFFMDMISKLDFIKVQKTTSKQKTIDDLKEAFTELAQIKAGKKKATPFKDFLTELKQSE